MNAALALAAGLASWHGTSWGAVAVSVKRKELIEVQRQLESKKREILEFRKQESLLKQDLSKLATLNSESERRIKALQAKIRESENRKNALKAHLGALHLAEGRWRGVLTEELRGRQRRREAESGLYGRGGLWRELFVRAAILEKVRYIEGVRGVQRKTEADAALLRRLSADLEAKKLGARAEQRDRESLYIKKKEIYQETAAKLEQIEKSIRELQDSAMALSRLLRALESKSPYKAPEGPVPLAEPKNSLPWPAKGRVVSFFGRRNVQELNTWVIQQGIRLATAARAPVHPVKAGKIIFSGPFRSYGRVLIVDHGQAFYTIYGQLGAVLKRKGDWVRPAEAIAEAGQAEGEGVVYFEVRQSGDALDPLDWLMRQP